MRQTGSGRRTKIVTEAPVERDAAAEASLLRRIELFHPCVRDPVTAIMRHGRPFEDLAESFPALLFALATGYGKPEGRRAAVAAVMAGAPLREIAALVELPMWLRKLPAVAFQRPLLTVPSDPALVQRLVSLVPLKSTAVGGWLDRVLMTHHLGQRDLTVWVAREFRSARPAAASAAFLTVLGWAWFSRGEQRSLRAGQLAASERWRPEIGRRRAVAAAHLWTEKLALDVCLGSGITDPWLEEGEFAGYTFKALRTLDDFLTEARAMDNCLDRFADRLLGRTVRIFSVRSEGRSVADIEIAPHDLEVGHPAIAQLRGPRNRRAPLEIWRAAYAWLGSQPLRIADESLEIRIGQVTRTRRREALWGPFIAVLPETGQTALEGAVIASTRRRRTARPLAWGAS